MFVVMTVQQTPIAVVIVIVRRRRKSRVVGTQMIQIYLEQISSTKKQTGVLTTVQEDSTVTLNVYVKKGQGLHALILSTQQIISGAPLLLITILILFLICG